MSQIFDVQIWDFGFASFSTSILTLFILIRDWERVGLKNLIQSLYNLYFRVWLVVVWLLLNLIKTEHNCGKTFPVIFLVCLVENLSVWIWIFVVFKTSLFYFAWSAAVFYPYRVGRFFLISHFGVPPFLHSFISHHSTTMKHGLSYWSTFCAYA